MADFEAPSFSLGLDFDLYEPQITTANEDNKDLSASNRHSAAATVLEDDDDNDFETLTVVDSDTDTQSSPPKLKRLRRGCTVEDSAPSASVKSKADLFSSVVVDDDDIEDFSSPEDNHTDAHLSTQHHSVCNSSKISLNSHGVLTKQLGKRKQNVSDGPESVITSCNKPPKLTLSPVRRFQLIDSDSDSDFYDLPIKQAASGSYSNRTQPKITPSDLRKQNESIKKDLWEDFRPEKSFHIPTPALDEVCDEYFNSIKDQKTPQTNTQKTHVTKNIIELSDSDPHPPAHRYFFHDDPRIQELVRIRLSNFFPLNSTNRDDSVQPGTSNIDYMGQFSRGETSKQAAGVNKTGTSSKTNSRKSNTQEMSQGSVNRKKRVPKDAGKRRVQADGQSQGHGQGQGGGTGTGTRTGHWFTNGDGKRVYVSKNGEELMGRAAYMLYTKESGAGYKRNAKAKKKTYAKRK